MEIYPLWAGSTTLLTFYDYLRKYRILYDIYGSFNPLHCEAVGGQDLKYRWSHNTYSSTNFILYTHMYLHVLIFFCRDIGEGLSWGKRFLGQFYS